jgi:hypothetical protein
MYTQSCAYVLEGHFRGATPRTERKYNALADKETDGDADCNLNHAQTEGKAAVVLLHRTVVVSRKTTSLRKARLERERPLSSVGLRGQGKRGYFREDNIPVRGRARQ